MLIVTSAFGALPTCTTGPYAFPDMIEAGRLFGGEPTVSSTRRNLRSSSALVSLILLALVLASGPANADTDRISRGEAAAVFQEAGSSGGVILHRASSRAVGAPANQNVAIRPYFDSGLHYCVEDWHTIVLAYIAELPTMQAARDALDPVVFTFSLDGLPLATERTQVKPFFHPEFLSPDAKRAFSFQQGALLSPSDLTAGSHTVTVISVNPNDPIDNFELASQFFVDAAGTGACL